jgi:phage terminase small subunit
MTPRQTRFVAEYLVDLNATQAAIRAGYSEKTAGAAGGRLLQNVTIREQIKAGQAMAVERATMDADAIVAALEDVYHRSVEMDTAPALGVATRSLELLGKRHAMFTDRQVVDATIAQKTPANVPEPANYAEWLASKRLQRAYPTTGGNGHGNGNGNGNRLKDLVGE